MRVLADALTIARLVIAIAFPWVLLGGGRWPVVLWAAAAASDFVDGPLARRAGGGTGHGSVLDSLADVTFVLGGLTVGAVRGDLTWLAPLSVAGAAGAYAFDSLRVSRSTGAVHLARSRIGRTAGVVNYVCVGVLAGRAILPDAIWGWAIALLAVATVVVNAAALAVRLRG